MKFKQLIATTVSITLIFIMALVIMILPVASASADTCTCITSAAQPLEGQKNRSSGNFSTQGCSFDLQWTAPDNVSFNVMQDRSSAKDPVKLENVSNGSKTRNPDQRSLYIANPRGASDSFTVCAENT